MECVSLVDGGWVFDNQWTSMSILVYKWYYWDYCTYLRYSRPVAV